MSDLITTEVLLSLKKGNHKAFEKVFIAYFNKVKHFIEKIIRSEIDAEELTQDIFVKLWTNRNLINVEKSFSSFLFTMAYYSSLNYLKHALVHDKFIININKTFTEGINTTEETIFATEINLLIELAVEQMPQQRKRIFLLSRKEGLSNEEIAKQLNISKKTVENQLSLALKELRKVVLYFFLILISGVL